jgi:hypothetical protein
LFFIALVKLFARESLLVDCILTSAVLVGDFLTLLFLLVFRGPFINIPPDKRLQADF